MRDILSYGLAAILTTYLVMERLEASREADLRMEERRCSFR